MAPGQHQHRERITRHILSQLVCLGRHTLTNLLTTSGRQFVDWSADYRLYGKERFDVEQIFRHITRQIIALNPPAPLVTALDDSLLRKSSRKIPGVKFARDPMGPPFQVNFVAGQRVIQMSAAVTDGTRARMIPVLFRDAATPDKPRRSDSAAVWAQYKELSKQRRLSALGVECIRDLREQLPAEQALWVTVDGSYTNKNVLRNLPQHTTLIGRIRRDAVLYHLPADQPSRGRKRVYGPQAPTPEALRVDDTIPWQSVPAYTSGKRHLFKVKIMSPLRWRASGQRHIVQIMVIAPLRYRLSRNSRLLYREPAYLLCTDPDLPPEKLLQAYLWRWDIEVNFRDEKSLLGTGQAQVRNPASVKAVPQMMVAAYSLLLLAGTRIWGLTGIPQPHQLPKWQNPSKKLRASANDFIKLLRHDLWAEFIHDPHLSHFVSPQSPQRSPFNSCLPPVSGLFYVNTG